MSIKAFLKRIEKEIEKGIEDEEKIKAAQEAIRAARGRKKSRSSRKKATQAPGAAEARSQANKAEARRAIEESRKIFRDYERNGQVATENTDEEGTDLGFSGIDRPSQETLRRAVIWSEILGPPKARRR